MKGVLCSCVCGIITIAGVVMLVLGLTKGVEDQIERFGRTKFDASVTGYAVSANDLGYYFTSVEFVYRPECHAQRHLFRDRF